MPARNRLVLALILVGGLLAIQSCGGDGGFTPIPGPGSGSAGDCGTSSSQPTASATSVYLAGQSGTSVQTNVLGAGTINRADLAVFDPANPAAGIISPNIANAGTYAFETPIEYGVYDATTKTLLEPYIRFLVFAQNGKLFKVDLRKSAPSLAPTQVSNETGADQICTFGGKQLVDYTNPDNTVIPYLTAGADGLCGSSDDVWKAIRLGMTATDAPLAARLPVTGLINSSGQAVGWLAINGSALTRYDENFQTPSILTNVSSGVGEEISRGVGAVEKAVVSINNSLQLYSCATTTVPTPFNLAGGSIAASAVDATAAYPAVTGGAGITIYRFPLDGSTPSIVTTDSSSLLGLTASAARLLYVVSSGTGVGQLKSVAKSGSVPATLKVFGGLSFSGTIDELAAANNQVYYNFSEAVTGIPHAGQQNDDGTTATPSEPANSRWLNLSLLTEPPNLSSVSGLASLVRAENVVSAPTISYAGVILRSFDPATGSQIANLGTMPASAFDIFAFDRNKDASLGQAIKSNVSILGAYTADIYSVDPNTAGSLTRVTTNIP
jgi:hypothetical protein